MDILKEVNFSLFYFLFINFYFKLITYFIKELYIDMDKSCYLALKYPIFSWFALIKNLLSIKWKKRLDTVGIFLF
jgi:hypothetical protein